ncbi:MAG TPA: sugar phosphate nucleotidyltransferase [Enhygromyxa sp.]|nr:sugar phosphate nucleotidyltransferase [Enhygromyxa sp.]
MWGIIPAAGRGARIQPLACSKELLPIGSQLDGDVERPRAVSEYLIERMITAGADRLCMVVSPDKSDLIAYYGRHPCAGKLCYVVQPEPVGLCDALFRALPFIGPDEQVLIGLPDTIWFPRDGFRLLPDGELSFLLFSVERPQLFDAVCTDARGCVTQIQVKDPAPTSSWIWGAFKLTGAILRRLHALWLERDRLDVYFGTLVNAYIADGQPARAVRGGGDYVDIGTIDGYRRAVGLLAHPEPKPEPKPEP